MIHLAVFAPTSAMRIGLRAMLQGDPEILVVAEGPMLAGLEADLAEIDVLVLATESPSVGFFSPLPTELPALVLLTADTRAAREIYRLPWRAWGWLTPDALPGELQAAVHAVHQGLLVGAPGLLASQLQVYQNPGVSEEALTHRERDVLQCLAQGLPNKQIGQVLNISEHTVKFHISSIYTKLGAGNRTEAVRLGVQKGLVAL